MYHLYHLVIRLKPLSSETAISHDLHPLIHRLDLRQICKQMGNGETATTATR
jgi:hypothetical protein